MTVAILLVLAAVAAIYVAGPRLSLVADKVATKLGVGQAVGGAVFLGLTTSLSGTVVSVTAAARGDAELALSNGLGGIVAQTAFLAVADCFHRRGNLEHDSGSVANLFQIGLLILLLSSVMVGFSGPAVEVLGLHPLSIALPLMWITGTVLASRTGERAPWEAGGDALSDADDVENKDREEAEGTAPKEPLMKLLPRFILFGVIVAAAGFTLSRYVPQLTDEIGLSRSAAGFLFTATATSLPELVTTIAAVRRGALNFAVGNIVGGNAFDTLFCTVSDAFYREGSIYHAAGASERLVTAVGLVMTSLLLLGLIGREKRGVGRIGTEGVLMLAVYVLGAVLIASLNGGVGG